MEPLPLLLTAVLLLLFNLIPHAQLKSGVVLLAVLLAAAAGIACSESRVLVVLVVCLGALGFVLLLTPGSRKWAFPASCAVALIVHAANGILPTERQQPVVAPKDEAPPVADAGTRF